MSSVEADRCPNKKPRRGERNGRRSASGYRVCSRWRSCRHGYATDGCEPPRFEAARSAIAPVPRTMVRSAGPAQSSQPISLLAVLKAGATLLTWNAGVRVRLYRGVLD